MDPLTSGFWKQLVGGSLAVVVYSLLGVAVVYAAVRFWDKVTPGHLEEEVFVKGNMAAAILGAAFVLGLSFVVAAAIRG